MITGEKHYGIDCRVFANSLKEFDDIREKIEYEIEKAVRNIKFPEGTEVIILARKRCSRCGESWANCQCGRPTERPMVS